MKRETYTKSKCDSLVYLTAPLDYDEKYLIEAYTNKFKIL